MKDILKERERGLEAEYFTKQNQNLVAKIRERAKLHEIATALADKLRVDDPKLLERAAALGLNAENGAAILVAPLVQVAWGEGGVTAAEKHVVLDIAAERGIEHGSADCRLLEQWLEKRPSDEVFAVAMEVLKVTFSVLPPDESEETIRAYLGACERVAQASGGLGKLLGISSGVSGDEAKVLDAITAKLRAKPTS